MLSEPRVPYDQSWEEPTVVAAYQTAIIWKIRHSASDEQRRRRGSGQQTGSSLKA